MRKAKWAILSSLKMSLNLFKSVFGSVLFVNFEFVGLVWGRMLASLSFVCGFESCEL